MEKKRILWIDVAKGICMLSVVAGHLGVTCIDRIVYAYHLTVFFILSGYTMKSELKLESVNKRFKRLMIPYFITCTAVTLMDIVNIIVLDRQTDFSVITEKIYADLLRGFMASGLIKSFGTIDIGAYIGAIWFLPAMFFASLLAAILMQCFSNRKHRYFVASMLALLAYITAQYIWFPFSIQSGIFATPLLLLGYDLRHNNVLEKIRSKHVFLCLFVFVIGILLDKTKIYFVNLVIPDLILSSVVSLAACVCIYSISKKLQYNKILAWIGKNSIVFLCVHLFEMNTLGAYFKQILASIGLEFVAVPKFVIKIIFITVVTEIIVECKKIKLQNVENKRIENSNRDSALDIAKAILIILMIIGHFSIDSQFRTIVYSFHMAAFIIYSGYCFKAESCIDIGKTIKRYIKKHLGPYAAFGVLYIFITHEGIIAELKRVLFGISFTEKIFTNIGSIGPVYFILLLFLTKVMYLFIERFSQNEIWKILLVLGLSLFGVLLGKIGFWLPWSADCALYALVFYYIGYCMKKYRIMEAFCNRSYSYFILSCIWIYMIFNGGMELAVRSYGTYGLTILGAVSATALLYMLCRYLSCVLTGRTVYFMRIVGENTLYVLIVHKLLNSILDTYVSCYVTKNSVFYVVIMMTIQLGAGILMGKIVEYGKKLLYSIMEFECQG